MSLTVKFSVLYLLALTAAMLYDQDAGLYAVIYYVSVSTFTFIFYAWDKRSAVKSRWRVAESSLHLLALLGGWPGALIAQQVLRHKTQKQPFKAILWLTVSINICAFIWLWLAAKAPLMNWLDNLPLG